MGFLDSSPSGRLGSARARVRPLVGAVADDPPGTRPHDRRRVGSAGGGALPRFDPAPLRGAPDGFGRPEAPPGRAVRVRSLDRARLLLRLRPARAAHRQGAGQDREGDAPHRQALACDHEEHREPRRGAPDPPGLGPGVQGRGPRPHPGGGGHHLLHPRAGRRAVGGPVRGTPHRLVPARVPLQAAEPGRGVLARGREAPDDAAHLRDGVLVQGGARRPPRVARGGQAPRSPQARHGPRPVQHPRGGRRWLRVLAPGPGDRSPLPRAEVVGRTPGRRLRPGLHAAREP